MANAQELENFGHQHPLQLLSEELNSQSEETKRSCARCGEVASLSSSSPCLGCVECGFYLHKKCADAPVEINHPFHRNHPLVLHQKPPYPSGSSICNFCSQIGDFFVYHCSCDLDLHIKCALFTYDIAEKNLKELQSDVANNEEPFHLRENEGEKDEMNKCFGCWEPLFDSAYFNLDSGFLVHKSCAELPLKINLMCHRKHPLFLQFMIVGLPCKACQDTKSIGFSYCCLPCKFAVHIRCASPSAVLEDKSHPHPFTLLWRQIPFICDACGTEGNYVAYVCNACSIIVHKKCISLPRFIKSRWHHHYLAHTYFIAEENYSISWDCMICHDEVNIEHGSYYCSDCKKVAHVNCSTKDESYYYIVSPENEDEKSLLDDIDPITVIERNAGVAVKIKHFKHTHDLVLSDKMVEYEYCDGCMLPIFDSFYYCLECDFFLHIGCAELPKMKQFWHHSCQKPLILTSDYIFKCEKCNYLSHGFAYKCNTCKENMCLRCVTLSPDSLTCEGDKHPLLFYFNYEGECRSCGCACGDGEDEVAYYCKECDFAVGSICILLPNKARHKCDKHLLKFTYRENNDYSESHYCDICEESRDPKYGFYHCATCDTSAHVECVLGVYTFIKPGSVYKDEDSPHRHPLTFVKKIYYYPDCSKCGKPCQDLALECSTLGCNYIAHWRCVAPWHLRP